MGPLRLSWALLGESSVHRTMGQGLPKAVTPIVVERDASPLFQVGLAEMNGWRASMEDAHVIVMNDSWGFFGVFDGHGGGQCSAFVASRLTKELSSNPLPADDAVVKKLMLGIDQEFLDSQQPSGSTGTFAIVRPSVSSDAEQRVELRVGNIGDSRVLLGRVDGTMVEGTGTDGGLTTDHKPDNEDERERIYRTGGTVETIMGVARVNGDLAVSRAFGDAPHKQTGGPAQEDHPVSVDPEFATLSCDKSDFLILVCDGISEGNFPNREVVALVAEELKTQEPAKVAAAVCRRALDRGSMDNLSCMIVLFSGGKKEDLEPHKELLSAPFAAPAHSGWRKAYEAMTERAGLSLEEAVERRYNEIRKERCQALWQKVGKDKKEGEEREKGENGSDTKEESRMKELRTEIAHFGEGPPVGLEEGSKERTAWFRRWLDDQQVDTPLNPANMSRDELLDMIETDPEMLSMAQAQGLVSQNAMRTVRLASKEELRPAMEAHPALKWDDRLQDLCGETGRVLQDDPSDSTSQVKFRCSVNATVWLPQSCLLDESETSGRAVRIVDSEESLRSAVDAHAGLRWSDEIKQFVGKQGVALQDDSSDGTTKVRFPELGITAWLPTSVLSDEDVDDSTTCPSGDDGGEDQKEDGSGNNLDEKTNEPAAASAEDESPSKKPRTS